MPICKFCSVPFSWGNSDGKWVPLVPISDHDGLDRTYQDENGVLRAEHALVCVRHGGPAVRVARLAVKVPGDHVVGGPFERIDPETGEIFGPPKPKKKRPTRKERFEANAKFATAAKVNKDGAP